MQTEPQITFRDTETNSRALDDIRDRIADLEKVHDRITACRVTVEKRTGRGQKGHLYQVRIDVEVPGGSVNVSHQPGDIGAHEDLHVAIRDSFNAARRQLKSHAKKLAGVEVKPHPETRYGTVARLFVDEGYGFVRMADGTEVYFGRDSVTGTDWDRLLPGSETAFSLMDGEKGPFAVNLSLRT